MQRGLRFCLSSGTEPFGKKGEGATAPRTVLRQEIIDILTRFFHLHINIKYYYNRSVEACLMVFYHYCLAQNPIINAALQPDARRLNVISRKRDVNLRTKLCNAKYVICDALSDWLV